MGARSKQDSKRLVNDASVDSTTVLSKHTLELRKLGAEIVLSLNVLIFMTLTCIRAHGGIDLDRDFALEPRFPPAASAGLDWARMLSQPGLDGPPNVTTSRLDQLLAQAERDPAGWATAVIRLSPDWIALSNQQAIQGTLAVLSRINGNSALAREIQLRPELRLSLARQLEVALTQTIPPQKAEAPSPYSTLERTLQRLWKISLVYFCQIRQVPK